MPLPLQTFLKLWVMNEATQFIHEQLTAKNQHPKFKSGDNFTVNYKIVEGGK